MTWLLEQLLNSFGFTTENVNLTLPGSNSGGILVNSRLNSCVTWDVTNVLRDVTRSIRYLQTQMVERQGLVDCRDWGLLDFIKPQKLALANLLGIAAQGALDCSHFLDVTQMDPPLSSFFCCERKYGQRKIDHVLRCDSGSTMSVIIKICLHVS